MSRLPRENKFQSHLINRLREMFPGCFIMKNDESYIQGIPDLTVLYGPCWAVLEVKRSEDAPIQSNQEYYVDLLNNMSFSAFIYPEIEEEVLSALQHAFSTGWAARIPQR